jgi:CDP-diacylglycerol--glycerol-3-phosphate 3-phosphatidyltransferase
MDDVDRWCALHSFERERVGPVLGAYLRAVYAAARRVPLSPGAVTLLALLVACSSVVPYALDVPAAAAPLVVLSGLLDSVDGAVAALRGKATAFGAVLDSTADRLSDLALLIGPALYVPDARPALVAAGAGTFLLEYVRARCQAAGWTDRQPVTPGERPTRLVAAALLAVVPRWWAYGAWTLAALTALGALMLLRDARARSTTAASA